MKKTIFCILLIVIAYLPAMAQEGLNVAPFFSDSYAEQPSVTLVNMSYDKLKQGGVKKYKSISVSDNPSLADKIKRAVTKDGASAESKEVSYREGDLYFGFYSMGGKKSSRRYLLYLNRRPKGIEKTTLIYIEGDLDEKAVKSMIKQ